VALPTKIKDKLFLNSYKHDSQSHLAIPDPDICLTQCHDKPCTHFCPSEVFSWNEQTKKIDIGWENCLETGACRVGCPFTNITYQNPRGGMGVQFKHG